MSIARRQRSWIFSLPIAAVATAALLALESHSGHRLAAGEATAPGAAKVVQNTADRSADGEEPAATRAGTSGIATNDSDERAAAA
ncbi:MAG TPA: hypothetical protein VGG30_05670 [Pirellulales bacterium]